MSEEMPCYKCGCDVTPNDKFCRECGISAPSQGMSWDWRDQPDFDQMNVLLAPYGCKVVEVVTGTDQHACRVDSISYDNIQPTP